MECAYCYGNFTLTVPGYLHRAHISATRSIVPSVEDALVEGLSLRLAGAFHCRHNFA
jgi:hypothetical protein